MINRSGCTKYCLTALYLVLLINPLHMSSQSQQVNTGARLVAGFKAGYGFLVPHHNEMEILNSHFLSWELSVSKATYGNTRWEYMYGYPQIGISLWHSSLGAKDDMGSGTALFPYIDFPIKRNQEHNFSFRLGLGFGYIEKPFDRLENYKNIAIGSHLNAAVNLLFQYTRRIHDQLLVCAHGSIMHFSNGSVKTPNFGINMPVAGLGVFYRLHRESPYIRKKLMPELYPFEFDGKKYFSVDIGAGTGIKNMQGEFARSFMIYNVYGDVFKRVSFKSSFGIGFDLAYDASDYFRLQRLNGSEYTKVDVVRPGLHLTYKMLMSRTAFVMSLGGYLSGKETNDGKIYERLSLRYYFDSGLYPHITLKVHGARADFIAFGIGYEIRFKYY